jgi:hypothetical protein
MSCNDEAHNADSASSRRAFREIVFLKKVKNTKTDICKEEIKHEGKKDGGGLWKTRWEGTE